MKLSDKAARGTLSNAPARISRRALLGSAGSALCLGCSPEPETVSYRYRLEATVLADGEIHRGASVIQVLYSDAKSVTNFGSPYRVDVWGEAPMIDLGPQRGPLFMLLAGKLDEQTGEYEFGASTTSVSAFHGKKSDFRAWIASQERGAFWRHLRGLPDRRDIARVPLDELPIFVRFKDVQDPQSVEEVDPMNLEATFGAGVKLEAVTMQMTDAVPTEGIREVLPWLDELDKTLGGPAPFDRRRHTFPQTLIAEHFRSWAA